MPGFWVTASKCVFRSKAWYSSVHFCSTAPRKPYKPPAPASSQRKPWNELTKPNNVQQIATQELVNAHHFHRVLAPKRRTCQPSTWTVHRNSALNLRSVTSIGLSATCTDHCRTCSHTPGIPRTSSRSKVITSKTSLDLYNLKPVWWSWLENHGAQTVGWWGTLKCWPFSLSFQILGVARR